MPRQGKEFEEMYKWLFSLPEKYKVKSPAYVYDKVARRQRELDVLVEYNDENGFSRRFTIECRDRKSTENVMWIEQLITKKNDLELDFIIATTTSDFSESAKNKARYYGVIIEKANFYSENRIDDITNTLFGDLCFLKFELTELTFLINGKILSFKELMKGIDYSLQAELIKELDDKMCFSINIYDILEDKEFSIDDFFKYQENSQIEIGQAFVFNHEKPAIIKELNISMICVECTIRPFKISLPFNKSLSVYDPETMEEKRYSGYFGNEDNNIQIFYLNKNEANYKIKFKKQRGYRYYKTNLTFNSLLPTLTEVVNFNLDELLDLSMVGFDYSLIT